MRLRYSNKLAIGCLVFKLFKLRFILECLFIAYLQKGLIKCINYRDEAGSVVGALPKGMGHHTL